MMISTKRQNHILRNKHNYHSAVSIVKKMLDEEKNDKIEELEKIGYGYNEYMELLLEQEIVIPYDFILLCVLIKNIRKNENQ